MNSTSAEGGINLPEQLKQYADDIVRLYQSEKENRKKLEIAHDNLMESYQKNMEQECMLIHQSRMADMGEMIGNIAHQWKQPLNALSILLFNIKDAFQCNSLDETYLNEAIATGNRLILKMSTTITDFRNFFRTDKEIKAFSAQEQIREAVALVEASFEKSNISVHIDAPRDISLQGLPNEYSHVLLNLLSNARDAIVKHLPPISGRVDIAITEQDGLGCVSVRDNGGGIPADIIGRIFDPYFSTKKDGSGIGLFMSKLIIAQHMNGNIKAKNIDGGTEFRIWVPEATPPVVI